MADLDPRTPKDTLVGGKYRLGPVIGAGGVATVYRATHIWTEREVAVKILDPTLPHFDRLREGFLREARATVQLDHPNVVDVLDMGEDGWEIAFLVMELLEGPTLRDVLLEHGHLDPEETLAVLLPLVDALEKAHELGIVHRDFKPENIMLTPDAYGAATPKLLDFGVAEILQDARARQANGQSDVIMGTPQYMAPEQARNQSALVGPHTDVWGVGVVLYECLTGCSPFDGESATEILQAVCDSAIDFDAAPEAFIPVLRDALNRSPQERISSLSVLKERLEQMGFTTASAPPPARAMASWPPPGTNAGVAQPTLSGLGPQQLFLPTPASTRVDTEEVQVPFRSNRRVGIAGLALTVAVALAAWWTVGQPIEPIPVRTELPVRWPDPEPPPRRVPSMREAAVEPAAELPAEAAAEPAAEPAAETAAEPAAELAAEAAAEPKAEPTAEPAAEAAAEPKAEAAAELAAAPAVEPAAELAATPAVEPAAEPKAEPAAQTATVEEAALPKKSKPPASNARRRRPAPSRPATPRQRDSPNKQPPDLVTEW